MLLRFLTAVACCVALAQVAAVAEVRQLGKIFIRVAPALPGSELNPELEDSARDLRDRKGDFADAQDEAEADFLLEVLERRVAGKDKFVLALLSAKVDGKWRAVAKLERDGGTGWGLAARAIMGEAQNWVRSRGSQALADPNAVRYGPPVNQVFRWLKEELPRAAEFSLVTRDSAGATQNESYSVDKVKVEACTIEFTAKARWNETSFPTTAYEMSLSDINVDSISAMEVPVQAPGAASRASFQVLFEAAANATFVRTIQGRAQRDNVAQIRIGELRSAHRVASALKAGAVLCGASSGATPGGQLVGQFESAYFPGRLEVTGSGVISGVENGIPIAGSVNLRLGGGTVVVEGVARRLWSVSDTVVSDEWDSWKRTAATPDMRVAVVPEGGSAQAKGQPSLAMTNADVQKLVTAGLSSQVVINAIRQAPVAAFDLSLEGLLALKASGVPDDVVVAMQDWKVPGEPAGGTGSARGSSSAPKYDSSLTYRAPLTAAQLACSGVESLGIFKNTALPRAVGGGVVQWLGKIRNSNTAARIVAVTWIDEYGQTKRAQVQIAAGQIADVELDLKLDRAIAPVKNFQVETCR